VSFRPVEIDTALAFLDAISRRDEACLLHLADPEIAIVGPRGTATGHEVLRQWFGSVRFG